MRSLFAKIFLSFLATVVLLAALLEVTTVVRLARAPLSSELRRLAVQQATDAASAYEQGGGAALDAATRRFGVPNVLLDERGHVLSTVSNDSRPIADQAQALLSNATEFPSGLVALRDLLLLPVTAASGRRYALAARLPHERWSAIFATLDEHPVWRVSAVGLVAGVICFGLARHITRPLVRLRLAARDVAAGRLDARAGPALAARRDEIGALGRDFDQMAGRLEALVSAERRLLADVSHELRSPLARLTVAVGLARQRLAGAASDELDRIDREVHRLDDVIGQSLTLARIESGVDAAAREPFDLTALVQEVVADGDFEARARNRRVQMPAAEPCRMEGAADFVRSAVENVVRNAIRHTAEGTAVEVDLRREAGARAAVVCVRDHGPGVPADRLPTIFLPFHRADSAAGAREPGAGLGLAIADRAVRMHGGAIRATNATGGGLLVEIDLPVS